MSLTVVVVLVSAMFFVLVCLAAAPRASAAVSAGAAGGITRIPSNDSLAQCPSSCGDVDITYPFGIGSGCFRQGFELTCNQSTLLPELYLGNTTTQITYLDYSEAMVTMFFNITRRPGVNTYNMSWAPPAKGITITSSNTFYVIGCNFDVTLSEYGTGDFVGSCMSRCDGEKVPNGGPCNGMGCCHIDVPRDLPGFLSTLIRTDGIAAAQSDPLHPGIMAFMADSYYEYNTSDLFSSSTDASNIVGAWLRIGIMDQPSCESAQMNRATYACSTGSNCQNLSSGGGYYCSCSGDEQGNPYVLNGCIDYNPKQKEHCPTSCGNMTIPFPFGFEEGCFANERFRLNCTADKLTVLDSGDAKYHVTNVSLEDGTLIVSNLLNNTSSEKEVIITRSENGRVDSYNPVEDRFDFSLEYDIVIRWAVANLTCQTAMQNNNMYACRSVDSYCKNVIHGKIFLGYRCQCLSGFQGNPYIQDGCTDIDECSMPNYCNRTCQNVPGGYICVTPSKLLLGIATGIGCGLGSIILAISATILAKKWKRGEFEEDTSRKIKAYS